MTVSQEYKEIFEKEILQKSKGVIFSYSPVEDAYKYQPYSHDVGDNAVEDLAALMRQNLLFYAFGEDEIVNFYYKESPFHPWNRQQNMLICNGCPKERIRMTAF